MFNSNIVFALAQGFGCFNNCGHFDGNCCPQHHNQCRSLAGGFFPFPQHNHCGFNACELLRCLLCPPKPPCKPECHCVKFVGCHPHHRHF